MVVPDNWSQCDPANLKMLFSITVERVSRKSAVGKLCGRWEAFARMKRHNVFTAVDVSMFVYIHLASAENKMAPLGRIISVRSSVNVVEFFMS